MSCTFEKATQEFSSVSRGDSDSLQDFTDSSACGFKLGSVYISDRGGTHKSPALGPSAVVNL